MCHMSNVTFHVYIYFFSSSLVSGGSLINGPRVFEISQVQYIIFDIWHLKQPKGSSKYRKCDIVRSIYGISNHPNRAIPVEY